MDSIKLACCLIVLLIGTGQVLTQKTGCGVRTSPESNWPWHVAVLREEHAKMRYVCAGTLISQTHVLTAAHCELSPKNGTDILVATADIQRYNVKTVHRIEEYNSESYRYDIAVLELESAVKLNKHVRLACLFTRQDITGMFGTLVSWETLEDGDTSIVQTENLLPTVDPLTCLKSNRDFFSMVLDEGMICAGFEDPTEICEADAGGGLFFEADGRWQLGAVMSFTNPANPKEGSCLTNEYVVFTAIFDYLIWIKKVTKIRLGVDDGSAGSDNCKPRQVDPSIKIQSHRVAFPRACGIAPNQSHPWMAIIRYRTGNSFCAGTLISHRYVLTSAHCVAADMHPYQVRLGNPTQDIDIECVIQHQDYRGAENNIALVRLAETIIFEDNIQPICLPTVPSIRNKIFPRYIVAGWDQTGSAVKSATVTLTNRNTCQNLLSGYSIRLTADHLCIAGSNSTGSIRGNHGGPLGAEVQHEWAERIVQYGIVSNKASSSEPPTVYTKVSAYMDWIVANMRA